MAGCSLQGIVSSKHATPINFSSSPRETEELGNADVFTCVSIDVS